MSPVNFRVSLQFFCLLLDICRTADVADCLKGGRRPAGFGGSELGWMPLSGHWKHPSASIVLGMARWLCQGWKKRKRAEARLPKRGQEYFRAQIAAGACTLLLWVLCLPQ